MKGTLPVFSSSAFNKHLYRDFSLPYALSTITLVLFRILLNFNVPCSDFDFEDKDRIAMSTKGRLSLQQEEDKRLLH